MRQITTALAFGLLGIGLSGACGNDAATIDASTIDTSMPHADAPPLIACTPQTGTAITLRKIGQVTGGGILATSPPNDGRLFVLQQSGEIRIFENETLVADPFLDLSAVALTEAPPFERGLLGLAFHPDYASNGLFYVYYTTQNANIVARYKASTSNYNKADPMSGQIILSIPDFAENHNGGMIEFGKDDGYLYISTGDGGSAGDPNLNGQALDRNDSTCQANNCEPLLAKILRIDVDHPAGGKMYGIPPNNPYAGSGGEPEILIRGVRNPWRWSFDRETGDLYIGDVGQGAVEEVDVIPKAAIDGTPGNALNMGWSMYEGDSCYNNGNGNGTCATAGKTAPVFTRTHSGDGWNAIIGGQVYRGTCYPQIVGNYYFSDNGHGGLFEGVWNPLNPTTLSVTERTLGTQKLNSPSSIHADARGELYATTTSGLVLHIEAGP